MCFKIQSKTKINYPIYEKIKRDPMMIFMVLFLSASITSHNMLHFQDSWDSCTFLPNRHYLKILQIKKITFYKFEDFYSNDIDHYSTDDVDQRVDEGNICLEYDVPSWIFTEDKLKFIIHYETNIQCMKDVFVIRELTKGQSLGYSVINDETDVMNLCNLGIVKIKSFKENFPKEFPKKIKKIYNNLLKIKSSLKEGKGEFPDDLIVRFYRRDMDSICNIFKLLSVTDSTDLSYFMALFITAAKLRDDINRLYQISDLVCNLINYSFKQRYFPELLLFDVISSVRITSKYL